MSTESAAPAAAAQPAPVAPAPAATAAPPAAPAATPAPPVTAVPVQLVIAQPAAGAPAPVAPPVAPVPEPEKEPEKEPGWLKGRIERAAAAERKKLLESLGVASEDDIKAAVKAVKDQEDAKKSLEQKALETAQALDLERKRVAEYQTALRGVADAELARLTEAQRAAVQSVAGDDPTRVLNTLRALSPTWAAPPPSAPAAPPAAPPAGVLPAAPAAPVAPPPAPAAPMVVQLPDGSFAQVVPLAAPAAAPPAPPRTGAQAIPPSPVNTAPPPGGPPPGGSQPMNAYETYMALRVSAPAAAADYLAKNAAAIERDYPKS